ncbi:glyoxalase [Coccidioides immitis RS]|uniref:Glyoxalase n=4 Tax=Coccidioides TaxID=5500 RepID=J3KH47_COCIM|nr:glyoxalase [Coccidioides immitis RS]XP_003066504.1 glyoxalase family protein [Coccidioides posadasii C735 delta SOWgp]EFW18570.1 conserved hypothetical protein [Coccidioides posadasii str. Silveira]EAS35145.3 glyoxalase [Coccidioides immitis RS]EER24359.1 glyoxalase family protein [Coccidioides posadasii C735 delta SOWgp]QVM10680.1 hypothetical protein D8B26_005333 [Coccidioides posadasii str. Silveira]|eukprot:XP_003066504.1 glyoxalase family protein [Coccidioides posadasii C735 delta SOWgp]
MPVSHLTLTVSNLPQSTSFFLSCLQPLGYKFIGRHENSIGFGAEPGKPADFWIAEERPGVPAGAAHIAFPAPSREAVSAFFIAALKAGGKIHGEPCLRDAEQGYFSAAVIDFDGNSIEAVNRCQDSRENDRALTVVENGSYVSRAMSSKSRAPKSEVGSVAQRSTVSAARTVPTIEQKARSAVSSVKQPSIQSAYQPSMQPSMQPSIQQSSQTPPQTTMAKPGDNLNGAKAVVGTLLGAAAGAAIAYAMVKGESQSQAETAPPQYTEEPLAYSTEKAPTEYRAIEAAPQRAMSVDDGMSAYAHTMYSKNPRASTIFEGLEQCTQLLSKAASLAGGNQSQGPPDIRRASSGSVVYSAGSNADMPIRAIEGVPEDFEDQMSYYNKNPSTFISSFTERPRRRFEEDRRSSYSGHSSVVSSSTVKPPKSTHSRPSSHHSHSSRSIITINDIYDKSSSTSRHPTASVYSATHSARNIPLPSGSVTTISTSTTSRSKRSSHHSHASSVARHVPLPASVAGTNTIFLDDVDVDSHVTLPTILPDGASRVSRRSSHAPSTSSRRRSRSGSRKGSVASVNTLRSSKFDEPVKPSDSVSQVGSNAGYSTTSRRSGRSKR